MYLLFDLWQEGLHEMYPKTICADWLISEYQLIQLKYFNQILFTKAGMIEILRMYFSSLTFSYL